MGVVGAMLSWAREGAGWAVCCRRVGRRLRAVVRPGSSRRSEREVCKGHCCSVRRSRRVVWLGCGWWLARVWRHLSRSTIVQKCGCEEVVDHLGRHHLHGWRKRRKRWLRVKILGRAGLAQRMRWIVCPSRIQSCRQEGTCLPRSCETLAERSCGDGALALALGLAAVRLLRWEEGGVCQSG